MNFALPRALRFALALFVTTPLNMPVSAQSAPVKKTDAVPWLYVGSDIPRDPAWQFGVLPNGVRYAVRNNGVPPNQVSIRIGMEAGSMMEADSERGFAHFIEHLVFRGSAYLSDGEAKRVWQRLGASFGSDTNASTTNTQTIYKLDLPEFTPAGLEESVKILSGMMMGPTLTQAEIDAERRTVLAEAREQFGPDFQANEATMKLFFAGQRFANRSPIGTVESLQAATPTAVRAFHDRWYRPERAVVVISGDGDPATFAKLIEKYFSAWQGKGTHTPDPDFGKPAPQAINSTAVSAPGLQLGVQMAWMRPWFQKNDTIAYNQGKLVDLVAIRLINRRLETRARAGGSFLGAQVGQDDVARSADGTFVSITPIGGNWHAAVRDVRAVIADALVNPSAKAEIEREANEFYSALQVGVETDRTEAASKLADDIIQAVDIRETVATAQVAFDVFGGMKDKISPAMILESTKRLFSGVGPRAVITSPTALAGADQQLSQAMREPVKAIAANDNAKPVSFADLPRFGPPGKIVQQDIVRELDLTKAQFANGVRFVHFANPAETGKVYVTVRFGRGMQAFSPSRPNLAWTGSALIASGIGRLSQDQIDRLASGRKINIDFSTDDDAFVMRAQTRQSDLADQLKLIASKLVAPGWDPAPVARIRAAITSSYDGYGSSPQGILGRDLSGLLRGSDTRWTSPTKAQAQALSPAAFRSFWEPVLATGPIEVMVFGDVTLQQAQEAVAASFGAMKSRSAARIVGAAASGPKPAATPIMRTHKGAADQASAVVAWATGGGQAGTYESRKLDVLAQIFGDRMFDQLREAEGASYSPSVDSSWPTGFDSGGNFAVIAQLKPDGVDRFYKLTQTIATDLASKPVTADELKRAVLPMKERISRASTGSMFWMRNLEGVSFHPEKIDALKSILADFSRITPADLQETAAKWLKPGQEFKLTILPEKK